MTNEEIIAGLKEVLNMIRPGKDYANINENSSLINDLGIDSLTMMLMSLGLEQKFNMRFESNAPFQTLGEVISYIKSKTE